jgi:hypothetical protein
MANASRPAIGSDDWMLEQQVRAELEAEAWRRLRRELTIPQAPVAAPVSEPKREATETRQAIDFHKTGSIVFKALVRVALAAFGAYLAWLAAIDGGLGEFESWLALAAGFLVTLSLSLIGPARAFVHFASEALKWSLIGGAAIGVVWLLLQNST